MNRRMSMVALLGIMPAVSAAVQAAPDSETRCHLCMTKMPPGTINLEDDGGWIPSYYDELNNEEVDAAVCPDCVDNRLVPNPYFEKPMLPCNHG